MARTVDFYQIYFEDDQLPELYEFAVPFKNDDLTIYFENKIISDLVPTLQADLICVASWRLRQKRGDRILARQNRLTIEDITTKEYDIAVLTPRSASHRPLAMAAHWHGQAWIEGFNALLPWFKTVGIRVPRETSTVYENHFIATREIYHQYVKVLKSCISYMDGKEVFLTDSGYKKKQPHERKKIKEKLGMDYWPIAPFLLERLFAIWIKGKNFKIINL